MQHLMMQTAKVDCQTIFICKFPLAGAKDHVMDLRSSVDNPHLVAEKTELIVTWNYAFHTLSPIAQASCLFL
jgi:hypothetical protein